LRVSAQRHFAEAVLAAEPLCPPGLMAWNGSDPAQRFAVYRNNVMVSLIDALADSYPVTQDLVGEEFFRAMARLFVRTHPPRSPVLALYGAGLAEFIEGFAPAAVLPYLADVARLEMLRVQAWHAADAAPLGLADFAALLENAPALAATGFDLHPSLAVLRSAHAVVSLWAAHQAQDGTPDLTAVDPALPESALVLRIGLDVEIRRIPCATAQFILHLQQGLAFGAAAQFALDTEPAFDLPAVLGMLICGGAIINLCQPRREPA